MTPRLGEVINQARRAHKMTLRQLADQVTKDDGTTISPQYLYDIELHHRVPTPHILRELARVLDQDYDTLLALAGAADIVVQEYLAAYPHQVEFVIRLFRAAQQRGFEDWERLRQAVEKGQRDRYDHTNALAQDVQQPGMPKRRRLNSSAGTTWVYHSCQQGPRSKAASSLHERRWTGGAVWAV